ncbi:MAG: HlyD family secretion protein [Alphaproteobacteria bacterium]|nr:HlyD family secretion protein [Alphaproteobacteria bacterium]
MSLRRTSRALIRLFLLIVVPLAAIAVGAYAYLTGGRYVTTENAYVKNDIVQVSADIEGRVVKVAVRDHEEVRSGDLLFRLDPVPVEIRLARAEAELGMVRDELHSLRAEYDVATGELEVTEGELREAFEAVRYHKTQVQRLRDLQRRGAAARVKLEAAEHDLAVARQGTEVVRKQAEVARKRMRRVLAELGGALDAPVESHPMYREKEALRDAARLDLERTVVRAAAGGIVSNVKLQAGEYVESGKPIFSIIVGRQPWVEANLKETELTHVRVGQKATVVVDAYPDVLWQAVVESISPATGAEFAVLPPQNATGNWVKVVQRLPVRLKLQERSGAPPLRAGMTVSASIDTVRERHLLTVIKESWARTRPDAE